MLGVTRAVLTQPGPGREPSGPAVCTLHGGGWGRVGGS